MFKSDTSWVNSGQPKQNPARRQYESFGEFFRGKPDDQPFCFWLGSYDAHPPCRLNSGLESGIDPGKVIVPDHLPADPVVRKDILDYYYKIQRWDSVVWESISVLDRAGSSTIH